MIEALEKSLGVVTAAVQKVGIARRTHYDWIDKDEAYSDAVKNIPEQVLDFAESSLFKLINEGNVAANIFYLKTKGKKRGFIERQEIDAKVDIDGQPAIINIIKPADDENEKTD